MRQGNDAFTAKEGHDYHWGFKKDENGEWVYDGKADVYDGRTGDKFDQRVMVGQVYMLKTGPLGRQQNSRPGRRSVFASNAAAARR